MKQTVDIIIPSFNGRYLLEKHLPHIIKNSPGINQIILIDNGSDDDTIEWLKIHYPQIKVIANSSNLGFTKPVNQGVAVSQADYLVLLNNDVHPEKDYLDGLIALFKKDSQLFAVSFNEKGSSWPLVTWQDGKLQFVRGEDKTQSRYSAWASGGSAIFRRSIWDKLGGLNEVYAPYYWEDIGLGYRAWKMGYHLIWSSQAVVIHEHESTAKKMNQNYVSLIRQRNELLFTWLNITDSDLRLAHLKFLVLYSLKHPGYLKVVILALLRLPFNRQKNNFTRSDSEVLSLVNRPYDQKN